MIWSDKVRRKSYPSPLSSGKYLAKFSRQGAYVIAPDHHRSVDKRYEFLAAPLFEERSFHANNQRGTLDKKSLDCNVELEPGATLIEYALDASAPSDGND